MSRFTDKFDGPIDIDAMLAKREEVVGSPDRFPFKALAKEWWCIDPRLADDDLQDQMQDLRDRTELDEDDADFLDGPDFRRELMICYLGEGQAEEFRAAGGQIKHLNAALEIYADTQADPTRPTSRATRRRAKRR